VLLGVAGRRPSRSGDGFWAGQHNGPEGAGPHVARGQQRTSLRP